MKILTRSIHFVPMIVVMGTIFLLSHQPAAELPLPTIPGLDKLAHGIVYAGLAAATLNAVSREALQLKPQLTGVLVVVFCLAYGLTDEYHQTFIPGREASLGDLAADAIGAAILVYVWFRFIRLRQLKHHRDKDEVTAS